MAAVTLATHTPRRLFPLRVMDCMVGQRRRTVRCPTTPSLRGKIGVVTGGGAGIGREISRGLALRGADVVIASRNVEKCEAVAEAIRAESGRDAWALRLDLSDIAQVRDAASALAERLGGRPVDILVNNAGVWPQRYAVSKQGHETSFAVNVLGHHVLAMSLVDGPLSPEARVIVVTGDIYAIARECTPEYRYRGPIGGLFAYCRSKLGNLWWARQLQRRFPALMVLAAHPGVVSSDLGVAESPVMARMKRLFPMPSTEHGAQTPLLCATQPDLEPGGYYHNTLGHVRLRDSDPASDERKAASLWQELQALSKLESRDP